MKLEVGHKEVVAGLTAFLAQAGVSGFDPATTDVKFSLDRKTGQLSAILDTDPAPEADKPRAEKPKTAVKPAAKAVEPEPEPEPEPEVETVAAADLEVTEVETVASAGDEDNLFG